MAGFKDRIIRSYNVLTNKDPAIPMDDSTPSSGMRDFSVARDPLGSVLSPIITRICMDVASVPIRHVKVDPYGYFTELVASELDDRLFRQANIDQTGAALIQDTVETMLTHGVAALVPIDVTSNPADTMSYDIYSLRVGRIVSWFNRSVTVDVYNEAVGHRVQINLPKSYLAICPNPLYAVMNEPNSTLKRLVEKRNLLDKLDRKLGAPGLDLILQLPYTVRSELRQKEALKRIDSLQEQLFNSVYGIAYVDGTEKITQLNRAVDNNLVEQILFLTTELYSQLGISANVFAGTGSPEEIASYNNRTVLPLLKTITDNVRNTFLTRTAQKQNHSVMYLPDLFKMTPISDLAEVADKLSRNAIVSSNEIRMRIGLAPDPSKEANELRNKNLNAADANPAETTKPEVKSDKEEAKVV